MASKTRRERIGPTEAAWKPDYELQNVHALLRGPRSGCCCRLVSFGPLRYESFVN